MRLRFILLLCLFSLLLFCLPSISLAANGGVFIETTYNGNGKAIIEAIIDNYFNGGETNNTSYLDTESAIFNAIEQPYISISLEFGKGSGTYWTNVLNVSISNTSFRFTNGGTELSEVAPYTNYQLRNYRNSLSGSSTNQTSNYSVTLRNLGSTDDLVAVYSSSYTNKWYQNSISSIHIGDYVERPDITFTPSALATLTTYNSSDVYLYRINRSVTNWNLGSLSDNFKEVEQLTIRLSPLQSVSGDNSITDGTYASSVYYHNGTILNNNKLVLGSNGGVSIPNYYVYYNNLYNFSIYYSYNGVGYNLNYAMYFKDIGSDTTINNLINPEANTGLDIDFINSLDTYLNSQTDFTSGDFNYFNNNMLTTSGDFFGIVYTDYDNWGFGDFVFNIYNYIKSLLTNFNNVNFDFGFLGVINSSSFIINNTLINNTISVFSNGLIILLIIFFYYRLIINISTLDLDSIFGYDFDRLFNLF